MISFEEARSKIRELAKIVPTTEVPVSLHKALQQVLATDIVSPLDMPPFHCSAMDGFAIGPFVEIDTDVPFRIIGEVKTGEEANFYIQQGTAVRIYTGGMVPEGTFAVVPLENTTIIDEHTVIINTSIVKEGQHIRRRAEQFKKGQVFLKKGTLLNESAIALTASVGINTVRIRKFPKVIVLITGNEIESSRSNALKPGKIYDSNSVLLRSFLSKWGIEHEVFFIKDNPEAIKEVIGNEAGYGIVIISTGGVSVGRYDYIPRVVQTLGFEIVFHKVKQKPGKPLLCAVLVDSKVVWWGLPGNPAAVWMCFNLYVLPFLLYCVGYTGNYPVLIEAETVSDIENPSDRDWLFGSYFTQTGKVSIFKNQRSDMLIPLTKSNVIAHIPARTRFKAGDKVKVFLI